MIRPLPLKIPRRFADALGYPRGMRWVSFFWEPCGDEAMYDDGYCAGDCNWRGFKAFVDHPNVAPWLFGCNLGSSDDEHTHRLLCDLESGAVFVGERSEVVALLHEEVRKYRPDIVGPVTSEQLDPVNIKEILEKVREEMRQVPVPSVEEIKKKMADQDNAVEEMVANLFAGTD